MAPPVSTNRWLPLALLCGFGLLTGLIVPLAKTAAQLGLPGPAFAFWQALGAGLAVLAVARARGQAIGLAPSHLRYYLVGGLVGIALPNCLIYLAVPHLGAGLTSLSYAFSPLFTLGLASVTGTERLSPRRAAGILLGVIGTLMIVLPEGQLPRFAAPIWLVPALAAPFSLAVGNIYRTRDWPAGAKPVSLAAGILLGAALELLPALLLADSHPSSPQAALLLVAAMAATGLAYMMSLELQRVAGPVYLSQVSFVITANGMMIGVTFLDERYGPWVWAAIAAVFLGVGLTRPPPHPAPLPQGERGNTRGPR